MQPVLKFRPPGAPAGTWHHTPWWVCVFHDPYERINFWSHLLPGLFFSALGAAAYHGLAPGGRALFIFCICATVTHMFSAVTHVWPDDHVLEKLDHIGIIALIIGTPLTAAMAKTPDKSLTVMAITAVALLGAAFLRPLHRTISFVLLGAVIFFAYFDVVDVSFTAEVVLYVLGAFFFVRNKGHDRRNGFTDHHLLHYFVTAACSLHVLYIVSAVAEETARERS